VLPPRQPLRISPEVLSTVAKQQVIFMKKLKNTAGQKKIQSKKYQDVDLCRVGLFSILTTLGYLVVGYLGA